MYCVGWQGNSAFVGGGVGTGERAILSMTDSTIRDNTATFGAGGMHLDGANANVTLMRTDVLNNSVLDVGGGIAVCGSFGGGLAECSVSLTMTDSAVRDNSAQVRRSPSSCPAC